MSIFSSMVGAGLSALSGAAEQSLQWRASISGSWTAFAAGTALLVPSDPMQVVDDHAHRVISSPQLASLRIILGGPLLQEGPNGAQVKDQNGVEWAVVGKSMAVSHTHYTCQRIAVVDAGRTPGRV